MKELLEIIQARAAHPEIPFVLATVVHVEGSSYRKPGARMLISLNGRVKGSVSGGCLERDTIAKGMAMIPDGAPVLVTYDTTDQDDLAFGASLGCAGRIEILLQVLSPGRPWFLESAAKSVVASRRPRVLATCYGTSKNGRALLGSSQWTDELPTLLPAEINSSELDAQLQKIQAGGKPQGGRYGLGDDQVDLLLERIVPPRRLVIFGAGHDVPPLVALAAEMGYHITVVDRRAEFADPARFPGATAVLQSRPHLVRQLDLLDSHTAVAVMNHHYETDLEILGQLLSEPLPYIGVMGPRKRTVKMLRELQERSVAMTPEDLSRIHAPVGLDLGSETPEQIALCILAEVQAVMSGRTAVSLRDRSSLSDEIFSRAMQPAALA